MYLVRIIRCTHDWNMCVGYRRTCRFGVLIIVFGRSTLAHLDLADAARHEVEQLLLFEVADRGAVRALDVVGNDLHGGHDRHAGLVAHQERAAQLVRVGLLCDLLGAGRQGRR